MKQAACALAVAAIVIQTAAGVPAVAQNAAPRVGAPSRPADNPLVRERPQRPRPLMQCASTPYCGSRQEAVCTERGACRRGTAERPDIACLRYACTAKTQSMPLKVLTTQPPLLRSVK